MIDIQSYKKDLDISIDALKADMAQFRTGRANAEVLEPLKVEVYGSFMPLKSLANISVVDSKTANIQPWDKSSVSAIAATIRNSQLGFLVSEEGDFIRIKFPEVTTERREQFVKLLGERVEEARRSIRNIRHKYTKQNEEDKNSGLSEDTAKRIANEIDLVTKQYNEKIEELREAKEKELMTL